MPRNKDSLWEYIIQEGRKVTCKFCHEVFVGGITRMRYHLSNTRSKDIRPCKMVPDSVREIALKAALEVEAKSKGKKDRRFQKSADGSVVLQADSFANQFEESGPNPKQKTICDVTKKSEKQEADIAIAEWLALDKISFDVLRSKSFREACWAIANAGPGYEPPTVEYAVAKLLKNTRNKADAYVNSIRQTWDKSGCSLMLDSWRQKNRSYLNLLVSSPKGVVYLKSLCTDGHATDEMSVFDFISSVVDEIGPRNVIQIISDSTSISASVGQMIEQKYPSIFVLNCAAHCIDLILKELDRVGIISPLLEDAQMIVKFVYDYQPLLDLMRLFANDTELKMAHTTRSGSKFTYLRTVLKGEQALRCMAATQEWTDLVHAKNAEGLAVHNLIEDNNFWNFGKQMMHAIEPLLKIQQMVESYGSTTGYIYEAMRKAKEEIKEVFKGETGKYLQLWRIIDDKWKNSLHSDIHAAAAYLNPHLFHDGHVKLDHEVKVGLEKFIQRMVFTNNERTKIAEELRDYHLLDPRIFGSMAIDSLHVSHPRVWWDMWGNSVPLLQNLAVKVLSQPCSFLSCRRNWSALDASQSKKKVGLDPMKLQNIDYVRTNIHLMKTIDNLQSNSRYPIELDKIEAFPGEPEGNEFSNCRHNSSNDEESEEELGSQLDRNGFNFPGFSVS